MRVIAVVLACVLLTGCSELVAVNVDVGELDPRGRPNQSVMLAADGTHLATLRVVNRTDAAYDDLPKVLIDAVIAAEDRRFRDHDGIDLRAIARAAMANRRAGTVTEGGSTITQQLVKYRWFPEAPDDFGRKVVEAHLARQLEDKLSKDEILIEYLNSIYFGAGAYGVNAAARTYFDVVPADLSLPQVALLAGLIRSPESASPYGEPQTATALRGRVLAAMTETGAITAAQATQADRAELGVIPRVGSPDVVQPWFVEHVKRTLLADPRFGTSEADRLARLYGEGLTIHTTLDPNLQAEVTAASQVLSDGPEVAATLINPHNGHLLAAVSGRDFSVRQFDLATQARRQPGSTFKTFALVSAIEEGWRLDDVIDSGGASFPLGDTTWRVRSPNAGPLTLRDATAQSSNGVFARLALQLGGDRIAEEAQQMGVRSKISRNPAIVLGGLTEGVSPLEMASAYGTLATGGVHVPVTVVTSVTDATGREVWRPDVRPNVATDAETAWLTTQALIDVIEHGTGRAARLDRPAAGKTGTVQRNTDAWFVGYTADLVASVWVGYPEGLVPMSNVNGVRDVTGGTWPARIWRDIMTRASVDLPVREFPYPDHQAVTVMVDPVSGQLATKWCPEVVEMTGLNGELPQSYCTLHGPPPPPVHAPAPAPTRPVTTTADPVAGPPAPAPSDPGQ